MGIVSRPPRLAPGGMFPQGKATGCGSKRHTGESSDGNEVRIADLEAPFDAAQKAAHERPSKR